MIELRMVHRMIRRGLVLAPIIAVFLGLVGSLEWAVSGVAGIAMTLGNLWLAARIIGGVAERTPGLLLPAALGSFFLGLFVLTGIALALRAADAVYFPVTGFVLIGTHLGLVLWEAAGAYEKVESHEHDGVPEHTEESARTPLDVRS
ncbi:MAG: hypothetical protein ACRDJS_06260 [Actinomycetota bacterium]